MVGLPSGCLIHELLCPARGCRFLLGGQGSCLRATLLERYGVSSLPHAFIGGQSVGGLYSGNNQGMPGLVELKKGGKLTAMLKEAKAL